MLQQTMQQQPVKAAPQVSGTGGWAGMNTNPTPQPSGGSQGWQQYIPQGGFSFLGNTKDPNSAQGQMDAFNKTHPYTDSLKWRQLTQQLGYGMQQPVLHALDFYGQMQPQQFSMIRNAMSALNPANRQGRVDQYRRDAMGQSLDQANSQMGMLGNLDENTRNAILLGAMNSSQQAGNEFMNQQYNPEQDVRNAMAAAGLLSPESLNPYMNAYQNLTTQGENTHATTSGGGIGGALIGAAGAAAGLGWSPLG